MGSEVKVSSTYSDGNDQEVVESAKADAIAALTEAKGSFILITDEGNGLRSKVLFHAVPCTSPDCKVEEEHCQRENELELFRDAIGILGEQFGRTLQERVDRGEVDILGILTSGLLMDPDPELDMLKHKGRMH